MEVQRRANENHDSDSATDRDSADGDHADLGENKENKPKKGSRPRKAARSKKKRFLVYIGTLYGFIQHLSHNDSR